MVDDDVRNAIFVVTTHTDNCIQHVTLLETQYRSDEAGEARVLGVWR